jgi:hypothetical protein
MRIFKTVAMLIMISALTATILFMPAGAEARKKSFKETPPPEIATQLKGLTAVSPQPQPSDIEPGLAVTYVFGKWRHLDDMPGPADPPDKESEPHKTGRPILKLDHQFGNGTVFDSGWSTGVGAHFSGMIRFPEAGDYTFQALSNDGVRVLVGGRIVVEDPAQHRDRVSVPVTVTIENPGWYSLDVKYYQRKGTAALRLLWQPPGASEFLPVPAEAYGHLKNK